MHDNVAAAIVLTGLLVTVCWVVYQAAEFGRRGQTLKAAGELHSRLLDKFGSAREVVDFLQTPGGAQFVESISSDRENPASGILRSTHRGIILTVLASGCLGLHWHYYGRDNPFLVIGVVLLCLGIGFLISAAVSHRLARTLSVAERTRGM
jgi:hypothetical protein